MKLLALALVLVAPVAEAKSHAFYSLYNNNYDNHIILQQSAESESGPITSKDGSTSYWKGYGITTTAGATYRDFVIGTIGYTMLDRRANTDDEHAWGNAVDLGLKLSFSSPIGSLEIGGGATAEHLSTSENEINGTAIGSGVFYSLGLNYLVSYSVSIDGEIKVDNMSYHTDTGSSFLDGAHSNVIRPALGFRFSF